MNSKISLIFHLLQFQVWYFCMSGKRLIFFALAAPPKFFTTSTTLIGSMQASDSPKITASNFMEEIEKVRTKFRLSSDLSPAEVIREAQAVLEHFKHGLKISSTSQSETYNTYMEAFYHSPIAQCVIRPDGTLVTANPAWVEMTGVEVNAKGSSLMSIVEPYFLPHIYSLLEKFITGKANHYADAIIFRKYVTTTEGATTAQAIKVQFTLTSIDDHSSAVKNDPDRKSFQPLLCSAIDFY
jgi:PAS domain-containing protein